MDKKLNNVENNYRAKEKVNDTVGKKKQIYQRWLSTRNKTDKKSVEVLKQNYNMSEVHTNIQHCNILKLIKIMQWKNFYTDLLMAKKECNLKQMLTNTK